MDIEKIRERGKRQTAIQIEEFKVGKIPSIFQLLFFLLFFIIFIIMASLFITNLTENGWTIVILAVQTVILLIQSWIIRNQTKYNKIPIMPEFVLTTTRYQDRLGPPDYIGISIKNIGETAHRVTFDIKATKRGETLNISRNRLYPQLYTVQAEEEKFACELLFQEYKEKTIRVDMAYLDKIGGYCWASFLKLSNEENFMPIFTGLE